MRKAFGDNHVLNGFNLDLFDRENVVILGKSGSGKSVLLKCIVRLMDYDSGTVNVLGYDISKLPQNDRSTSFSSRLSGKRDFGAAYG